MILTLVGVSQGVLGDIAARSRGTGADILVQASATTTNDATADATAPGFANTGVGASVAFNAGSDHAQAEIGGVATAPDQVQVLGQGDYTVTTTAEAGATGGTAVTCFWKIFERFSHPATVKHFIKHFFHY